MLRLVDGFRDRDHVAGRLLAFGADWSPDGTRLAFLRQSGTERGSSSQPLTVAACARSRAGRTADGLGGSVIVDLVERGRVYSLAARSSFWYDPRSCRSTAAPERLLVQQADLNFPPALQPGGFLARLQHHVHPAPGASSTSAPACRQILPVTGCRARLVSRRQPAGRAARGRDRRHPSGRKRPSHRASVARGAERGQRAVAGVVARRNAESPSRGDSCFLSSSGRFGTPSAHGDLVGRGGRKRPRAAHRRRRRRALRRRDGRLVPPVLVARRLAAHVPSDAREAPFMVMNADGSCETPWPGPFGISPPVWRPGASVAGRPDGVLLRDRPAADSPRRSQPSRRAAAHDHPQKRRDADAPGRPALAGGDPRHPRGARARVRPRAARDLRARRPRARPRARAAGAGRRSRARDGRG